MRKISFFFILFISLSRCLAQINTSTENFQLDSIDKATEDSIQYAHQHSSLFSYTSQYTNKVVFRGRDFGHKQYGISNELLYKSPKGFYCNLNTYSWSGIQSILAKTDVGIGIEKPIGPYVNLNASYERWFFADDPFFDPTALNNMFAADLSSNLNTFNVEFGYYYIWGDNAALLMSLAANYPIDLPSVFDELYIGMDPTLLGEAFAGDNNMLSVGTNNGKIKKTSLLRLQKQLSMANYEFSLPVYLVYKNITLTPTYHFSFPIAISNEDPPLSNYLVGGFSYFTLSAQFDFYFMRKHEKK